MTAGALILKSVSAVPGYIFKFVTESIKWILRPFTLAGWKEELNQLKTLGSTGIRHSLINAIPKLAIYYVFLAPVVATPLYNNLVFHPFAAGNYNIDSIGGVPCKDLYFPAQNGKRLNAWYFKNPGATKTILLSHGNAGNITDRYGLIQLLLGTGASVFAYDYQGFGKSQGSPSLAGICADGLAAYNYLVNDLKVEPSDVVLFGESIGTGATCAVASKVKCAGIVLQSPFTSLPAIAREKLKFLQIYPDWLFPSARLDNLTVVLQQHAPLLMVHGMQDEIVPVAHSQILAQQASEPKALELLPHAGHNDIYSVDSQQYFKALRLFITSLK